MDGATRPSCRGYGRFSALSSISLTKLVKPLHGCYPLESSARCGSSMTGWDSRFFESTRGQRGTASPRRAHCGTSCLALGVPTSRAQHLAALERDGLVIRRGVRSTGAASVRLRAGSKRLDVHRGYPRPSDGDGLGERLPARAGYSSRCRAASPRAVQHPASPARARDAAAVLTDSEACGRRDGRRRARARGSVARSATSGSASVHCKALESWCPR